MDVCVRVCVCEFTTQQAPDANFIPVETYYDTFLNL